MMLNQDVVRRLSVVATETGLTAVNTKLREHERLQSAITAGSARMSTATAAADRHLQALLRQRDRYVSTFNNSGVGGVGMLAGSDATAFAVRNIAPFAAAGTAAYAAIAGVNLVIERGTELLEKYANAQRRLDRSDLATNMGELTKFQNETISAAQVKYATELGGRLADARFQIDEFLKVQFDVVDPALKLQGVWVRIVESIASATQGATRLSVPVGRILGNAALNLVPGGRLWALGLNHLAGPTPLGPTAEEQRAAGYKQLAAAMGVRNVGKEGAPLGGSFAATWNDYMTQLYNGPKAPEEPKAVQLNAYDQLIQRTKDRVEELQLEAMTVGQVEGAVAKLRLQHEAERAARQANVEVNQKELDQLKEGLALRMQELSLARLRSDLRFERDQLGRTEMEQSVASRLRSAGLPVDLQSTEAQLIRVNEQLRLGRDLASEFFTGLGRDIFSQVRSNAEALRQAQDEFNRSGRTPADVARFRELTAEIQKASGAWAMFEKAGMNALNRVADRLMDMVINNLVARALGGLGGAFFNPVNVGSATSFIPTGHTGGMANELYTGKYVDPAYFDMAPRFHSGRIAPYEMPAIIRRDESVLTPGQMRAISGAGRGAVNVVINNNNGSEVSIAKRENSEGGIDLQVMVDNAVSRSIGSGRQDRAMAARFGAAPGNVRR